MRWWCEASRQSPQLLFNNLPMKRGRTEHAGHIPPAIDLCVLEMWCLVAPSLRQSKNSECYRGSIEISPSPRESIHSLSDAIFFCFPASYRLFYFIFFLKSTCGALQDFYVKYQHNATLRSLCTLNKKKKRNAKKRIRWVSKGIRVALSLYLIRLQSNTQGGWGRGQKEAKQLIVFSAWHLISTPQKVYYRSKTVIKP